MNRIMPRWFLIVQCLVVAGAARADERGDELERLKARVEALEKATPPSKDPLATPKIEEIGKNTKMEGNWKNGLVFETPDKAFRWTVGGTLQYDNSFFAADRGLGRSIGSFNSFTEPALGLQDGMSFRRARLRFGGLMWEQVEFYAQYEFAQALDLRRRTLGVSPAGASVYDIDPGDDVGFNEVYVGFTKIPYLGTIRVGRHRESLNFVTATADNNQVWMERGLMFDAFNGDFNFSNGVTAANTFCDDRVYALLGFFHSNNNSNRSFYAVGDGEYAYDARLTALPVYDEGEKRWVHVGADYSYRNPHQNQLRYRTRPDERAGPGFLAPNLLNTGTIFTPDGQQIANLEFAMAEGRFTMAAEASGSWVTNAYTGGLPIEGRLPAGVVSQGTYSAYGGYVEALCFLTPDHRKYVKDRPGYARVVPEDVFYFMKTDTGLLSTRGAWEVGVRYEYLDLTSNNINGGVANAASACVNWYLNANARIQANYTWIDRRFSPADAAGRVGGGINAFGLRFNCDF